MTDRPEKIERPFKCHPGLLVSCVSNNFFQKMSSSKKTFLDLSVDKKAEFLTLYNDYKSAHKQDDRAKKAWVFLCFVYKHLGNEMLTYFTENIFDSKDVASSISGMIQLRSIIQPRL